MTKLVLKQHLSLDGFAGRLDGDVGFIFSSFDDAPALKKALTLNAQVVTLAQLHEASMRKIDAQNVGFQAAMEQKDSPQALGLLERQRVKTWLKSNYEFLDTLPI